MDFFKSLEQSFLKFNNPEAISQILTALAKCSELKKRKKLQKIPWTFLNV